MEIKQTEITMKDEAYMALALTLAQEAAQEGEVPIGAVVILGDRVVGRGRNRREKEKNALCHAELEAINEACRTLGGWRLWECTLYVTVEPCPMCMGAILNARIPRLVFGLRDHRTGACGSAADLRTIAYYHKIEVTEGICQEASQQLMQTFFDELRTHQKPKWKPKERI